MSHTTVKEREEEGGYSFQSVGVGLKRRVQQDSHTVSNTLANLVDNS